jgi:outer membrane protein assembly factor BamB
LNPNTGQVYWSEELEPDYSMSIAPPLRSGKLLFVGAIKNKSMVVELDQDKPAARLLWKGKNGVGVGPSHCPVAVDPNNADYIYGVDRGGLRCVKLSTGEHMWETYELMASKRRASAGNIFITLSGDRFFLYSETGELVIAKLSPRGYKEVGRTKPLLEPTHSASGRAVVWSPPAFANQAVFVRNDNELVRVSLKQ